MKKKPCPNKECNAGYVTLGKPNEDGYIDVLCPTCKGLGQVPDEETNLKDEQHGGTCLKVETAGVTTGSLDEKTGVDAGKTDTTHVNGLPSGPAHCGSQSALSGESASTAQGLQAGSTPASSTTLGSGPSNKRALRERGTHEVTEPPTSLMPSDGGVSPPVANLSGGEGRIVPWITALAKKLGRTVSGYDVAMAIAAESSASKRRMMEEEYLGGDRK